MPGGKILHLKNLKANIICPQLVLSVGLAAMASPTAEVEFFYLPFC
jgi:hypothetical protein